MATYKIEGGRSLNGTITPVPNKNSILKLIPAALLTDEPVIIHNVPKSSDVRLMLKIVKQLGGRVSYIGDGSSVRIQANDLTTFEIDSELSQKAKSSVMFMAPLLLRFKKAYLPIPGGCKLGTRPLDAFIDNMVQMGVEYRREKGYFLEAKKLKSAKIWSWFPSVTGTENTIMLAVLTPGITEIYNAACEPHTQDLCNMLNAMGAKVSGIGSNKLLIEGVEKLNGVEWTVISDHLDVGAYISAALLTNGEITIKNAIPEHMQLIIQFFQKLNAKVNIKGDEISIPANQKLECDLTVRGDIFDVKAFTWPFLPPDFVHVALVTALKAKGSFVFHNSFYEYGFFFIEELAKMKAKLIMADPYRIITFGPTDYQGAKIIAPNIIQATMGLFLAALSAPGVTILEDSDDSLLRRYPDLIANYKKLGAKISNL
jgi:UDP-N-acetylglucosamine 1-carboxyvinyltransferase